MRRGGAGCARAPVRCAAVARIFILAGGCRGRALAASMIADGHVVRISTRSDAGRAAIEAAGAECWIGSPERLATLRGALDGVTVACWLLGSCLGSERELRELHTTRLALFLTQAVDTTVRALLYEARGTTTPQPLLADGERAVRQLAQRNAIPARFLRADPRHLDAWLAHARAALASLLSGA
jgi:uncharacterized protein YbjT (DUF2867 family)